MGHTQNEYGIEENFASCGHELCEQRVEILAYECAKLALERDRLERGLGDALRDLSRARAELAELRDRGAR